MNDWDEDNLKFAMALLLFAMIYILGHLFISQAYADNTIYVEQVGSYNSVTVNQDGQGHSAKIFMGSVSAVDNTTVTIDQRTGTNPPGGLNTHNSRRTWTAETTANGTGHGTGGKDAG